MMTTKQFSTTLCALAGLMSAAFGQAYQLTENTWDNPRFVARFVGDYAFDQQINPQISAEEAELFKQVAASARFGTSEAIRILEPAILPESSAALDYTLGSLYLQQGRTSAAIRKYEDAIRKFSNFYRAYKNLGLAYLQGGNYQQALDNIVKAVEIAGGDAQLYGFMGFCYLNLGRATLALDAYRLALLLEPDSRDWRIGKLKSLLDTNHNVEAIAMLGEMLKANPNDADMLMQQANAYLRINESEKAAANLELVDMMGKSTPTSLVLLGDLYVNREMTDLAARYYERAVNSNELDPARALRLANVIAYRDEPADAARFIANVEQRYGSRWTDADQLKILNLKAQTALANGQADQAAEFLKQVTTRDPLNGDALITLGNYYRDKGEVELAAEQFKNAASIPDNNTVVVRALHQHARLMVAERNYRQAIDLFSRAQDLDPRSYVADYIDKLRAAIRSQS